MSNNQTDTLTISEAAQLLRVTTLTLANWRNAGTGPPWIRLGPRTVRYRHASLVAYLDELEGRTDRTELESESTKPGKAKPEPQQTKPRKPPRTAAEQAKPKKAKRGRPTNRAKAIKAAILKLDPYRTSQWVPTGFRAGQPKLSAVQKICGFPIFEYDEINAALPGWTREKAKAAASKSKA